jgi:hypothetical protein
VQRGLAPLVRAVGTGAVPQQGEQQAAGRVLLLQPLSLGTQGAGVPERPAQMQRPVAFIEEQGSKKNENQQLTIKKQTENLYKELWDTATNK